MSAAICAAAVGAYISSSMADDNGAEDLNASSADANKLNAQISREQWNNYKENYQPLENALVAEASNYDTPENYAKAAGNANATVSSEFGKARDALTRTPGLDPTSASYQAGMTQLGLAQAANGAVAQNAARQGVADTAYSRKLNAVSLGKGLPAQAQSGLMSSANMFANQANNAQAQANGNAIGVGDTVSSVFTGLANYQRPAAANNSVPSANYTTAMNTYGTSGGGLGGYNPNIYDV